MDTENKDEYFEFLNNKKPQANLFLKSDKPYIWNDLHKQLMSTAIIGIVVFSITHILGVLFPVGSDTFSLEGFFTNWAWVFVVLGFILIIMAMISLRNTGYYRYVVFLPGEIPEQYESILEDKLKDIGADLLIINQGDPFNNDQIKPNLVMIGKVSARPVLTVYVEIESHQEDFAIIRKPIDESFVWIESNV